MKYRHEWKHEINPADLLTLRTRLGAALKRDPHAIEGKYFIRSLYFDTPTDKALREKIDGVNIREKFRVRYYNFDPSFISLEKKSKINGLCAKESCVISAEEAERLVRGDIGWLKDEKRPLCLELWSKMMYQGLRPRTIVDYTREPFVYGPGNVRVTMDYDIRTGLNCIDFLNPKAVTIPAGDRHIILEVKWDDYLPDVVKSAVTIPGRKSTAFSKYAQCRVYD